jgi:hypothetical protein
MPKASDLDIDFNNPLPDADETLPDGAQHGETHTNRPGAAEAKMGQGSKTRRRNKEIVQGGPFKG